MTRRIAVALLVLAALCADAGAAQFYKLPGNTGGLRETIGRGECGYYDFTASASVGPVEITGATVKFSIDGDTATTATTGATANVTGCTRLGSSGDLCSCDLAWGGDACWSYDGTTGSTGFLVVAPQRVSVNVLSASGAGRVEVCSW